MPHGLTPSKSRMEAARKVWFVRFRRMARVLRREWRSSSRGERATRLPVDPRPARLHGGTPYGPRRRRMSFDLVELLRARHGESYALHDKHLNHQLARVLKTIGFDRFY